MIVRWDPLNSPDGKLVARFTSPVYSLAALPGNAIAAGARTGRTSVIHPDEQLEQRSFRHHIYPVFSLAWFKNFLFSGDESGMVAVSDWETEPEAKLQWSDKSVRSLAVSQDQQLIAAGFSDHHIRVFNEKLEPVADISAHDHSVFALSFSPDGRLLASGGRDARLRIFDVNNRFSPFPPINAHWFHIHAVAFSPDGRYLITGSMDKTIKIWDASTFDLLKVIDNERFQAHTSSVNALVWLDDLTFASAGDDRTIQVYRIHPAIQVTSDEEM